jgi:hypothetical protein
MVHGKLLAGHPQGKWSFEFSSQRALHICNNSRNKDEFSDLGESDFTRV